MKRLRMLALMGLAWSLFWWSGMQLRELPRDEQLQLLRVRLPLPVQLMYATGDRYLAADLNVFRSLMVDARITEGETYRVQGQLQVDAAFFNPRHEDNYYLGAAILPWNGELAAAQGVLLSAAQSRDWDMWPAFFYAFNAMYFERDMAKAGHWAEVAAERDPINAVALRAMAAKWYERGEDPELALAMLNAMYQQSRDENFRRLIKARQLRLEGLLALRRAASAYRQQLRRAPSALGDLLGYAGLVELPMDPLQLGYALNAEGIPVLVDHKVPKGEK